MLDRINFGPAPFNDIDIGIDETCCRSRVDDGCKRREINNNVIVLIPELSEEGLDRSRTYNCIWMQQFRRLWATRQKDQSGLGVSPCCVIERDPARGDLDQSCGGTGSKMSREGRIA